MGLPFVELLLVVVAIAVASIEVRRRSKRAPLPPGPAGLFLLGNVLDVPTGPEAWKDYAALGKRYGPVSCLRVLNQTFIILNTKTAINDLLNKRSAIYSDRPRLPMLIDVVGYSWVPGFMPYGSWWRKHRRILDQQLGEGPVQHMSALIEENNVRLLKHTLNKPAEWEKLLEWSTGALVMRTVYGITTQPEGDPWIQLGLETIRVVSQTVVLGSWAVNLFPALMYLPTWFPGAQFKKIGSEMRKIQVRSRELPFAKVVKDMDDGIAAPCMTTQLLQQKLDGSAISDEIIKNAMGNIYIAGNDTVSSTFRALLHAMLLHPNCLRRAQEELDNAIPSARLPTLQNRNDIPYIEALVKETMRVYPVGPLGVPHSLTEEDVYEGMRIPKGSVIIPNVWGVLNDETLYPSPEEFRPERFLRDGAINKDVYDPRPVIFGFGRRICPGRHFAEAQIWLFAATILYCFNVIPAKDEDGRDIIPPKEMKSSVLVSSLAPFPCQLVPRSASHRGALVAAFVSLDG